MDKAETNRFKLAPNLSHKAVAPNLVKQFLKSQPARRQVGEMVMKCVANPDAQHTELGFASGNVSLRRAQIRYQAIISGRCDAQN